MKLLICDDEPKIRMVVKEYSKASGYEIDEASDGMEAIQKAKTKSYDLILMDIMMPYLNGIDAAEKIKEISPNTAILFLSAKSEEYDKLTAFNIGADDYVTKPFSPKELMARINAILKRNEKKHKIYNFDTLCIDMTARKVEIDSQEIKLSPKEYDLLFYLVINNGIALSREKLLSEVWGYDFFGEDRTVDTHIKTLRSNLGRYRDCITTVRAVGYKFEYNENE